MSGRDENNTQASKSLESLPTETLEDMLRWYAISDDNVGEERISEIISELKSREEDDYLEPNVDQALRDFFDIYSDEESEYTSYGAINNYDGQNVHDRPRRKRFVKAIAVLAAVVALLMAGTVIAYAAGYDVFNAVANWANETFNLEYKSAEIEAGVHESMNTNADYSSMAEIIEEYGLYGSVEPKWVPSGFGEPIIEASVLNNRLTVTATYSDSEQFLIVTATEIDAAPEGATYEIDSELASEYAHNDINFYIMSNYDATTVVWNSGDFECSIVGNIGDTELAKIIDSI